MRLIDRIPILQVFILVVLVVAQTCAYFLSASLAQGGVPQVIRFQWLPEIIVANINVNSALILYGLISFLVYAFSYLLAKSITKRTLELFLGAGVTGGLYVQGFGLERQRSFFEGFGEKINRIVAFGSMPWVMLSFSIASVSTSLVILIFLDTFLFTIAVVFGLLTITVVASFRIYLSKLVIAARNAADEISEFVGTFLAHPRFFNNKNIFSFLEEDLQKRVSINSALAVRMTYMPQINRATLELFALLVFVFVASSGWVADILAPAILLKALIGLQGISPAINNVLNFKKYFSDEFGAIKQKFEASVGRPQLSPRTDLLGIKLLMKDFCLEVNDKRIKYPNVEINSSQIVISGPSGAGKSTWLDYIVGYNHLQPAGIFSLEIRSNNEEPLVFYQPQRFALTAIDALQSQNNFDFEKFSHVCELLNVSREIIEPFLVRDYDLLKRVSNTISGGEAQRVGLARALAHSSDLLILDEPTNNLPSEMAKKIAKIIIENNTKCLVISHSEDFIDSFPLHSRVSF